MTAPASHRSSFSRKALPIQTEIGNRRLVWVYFALALGGFGIGVTEFVSMGVLPLIAESFGITEDQAGHVISAYAAGVVVGAPVLAVATARMPRRRLLLILMAAFILGNGLSAVAPNYPVLMLARFVAGIPHGAFFSVSGLAVASLAGPHQRGKAISLVSLGLPVATLAGVPAAQALAQLFGWPVAYFFASAVGVVCLALLWVGMPHMTKMPANNPMTELGALAKGQVWLTLLIGAVGFGGMFAVYTYISWIMVDRAGMNVAWMPFVLMLYGIGMVFGTMVSGRVADRGVMRAIIIALVLIAVVLVLFFFASTTPLGGAVMFCLVGFSGSMLVIPLQIRLMDVGGRAQTLAAALNHSALNLANGGGAAMGGAVIAAGYGYGAPALAGAVVSVLAMGLWGVSYLAERRSPATTGTKVTTDSAK